MENNIRKSNLKNDSGSISVLVVVTILAFVIILMAIFSLVMTLQQTQLESDIKIKEIYEADVNRIEEVYKYAMLEKGATVPEIEARLYQINGQEIDTEDRYKQVAVTIKVPNKKELEEINEITLKKEDGEALQANSVVIGDKESDITFMIDKNAKYIAEVTATTYGVQKSSTLEMNIVKKIFDLGEANEPVLADGMTAIKFTEPTDSEKGKEVVTNSDDLQWYDYGEKKWANAQTKDGSMWVWIPRFAYKIDNESQKTDIVFLMGTTDDYYDENGNIQTAKRISSEEEGYIVHPAFTNESDSDYANGGWDKEIRGIWVAKFEAGYAGGNNEVEAVESNVSYIQGLSLVKSVEAGTEDDSEQSARNWLDGIYAEEEMLIKYPVFQGTTYSMNYINVNDAYNISKSLTNDGNIYGLKETTIDSHLMKNSEWEACEYLGKSQYGLNDISVAVNNISLNSGNKKRTEKSGKTGVSSVYAVTGCTTGQTEAEEKQTTIDSINSTTADSSADGVYVWNQKTGQSASNTGNIYGVYDLNGGGREEMASYIAIEDDENLKKYAESMAYDGDTLKTISTKYVMVYQNNEEENVNNDIGIGEYSDGFRVVLIPN